MQNTRLNQIISLSATYPHKRTRLAVDYLSRWQRTTGYQGCVEWVGPLPAGTALPNFPNWKHHQRLPQDVYENKMKCSRVLIFFSDYEGFGMPPVEALLSGVCPVYSDIEATREVMAGTGCPFSNESYESFASAMESALSMPADQIETWKRVLADVHNWTRVRSRIVNALGAS
jgi:glycosyltransferase involved in cell wall biosynthesis